MFAVIKFISFCCKHLLLHVEIFRLTCLSKQMPQALLSEAKCQKLHVIQNIKNIILFVSAKFTTRQNSRSSLDEFFRRLNTPRGNPRPEIAMETCNYKACISVSLTCFCISLRWLFVGNVNLLEV